MVQLWDAHTHTELMQFREHAKRVWSVDFSRMDPTRLVSGSDDGTAKIWALNQEHSVATLDGRVSGGGGRRCRGGGRRGERKAV